MIQRLLSIYDEADAALRGYANEHFPVGSFVYVKAPSYVGYGIASREDSCPADKLPVFLPNGNVWWYPLAGISKAKAKDVSRELRRLHRRMYR